MASKAIRTSMRPRPWAGPANVMLSPEDGATVLGLSRASFDRPDGIPRLKLGSRVAIPLPDLSRWIEQRPTVVRLSSPVLVSLGNRTAMSWASCCHRSTGRVWRRASPAKA
jgi:hypothetical protein